MCHDKVEKHFYCAKCQVNEYLGTVITQPLCPVCGADLTIESNTGMFLVLPLDCQLREMFEHSNVRDAVRYPYNRTKQDSCNIEDMYDGSAYQSMRNFDADCISMTWNCDGVKAFNSSTRSIWPLQCVINELPYHIRRLQVLLTGLLFGLSKPSIHTFLKPFVEQCRRLEDDGFAWYDSVSKCMKVTRVFTVICSCDSVARSLLQNIKQFNGMFGCAWCLHPGVAVNNDSGGPPKRVYPAQLYPPRSHKQYIEDAQFVLDNGEMRNGVKGANPLLLIKNFDIVHGFIVDYMHGVLLGVSKHICTLWFESKPSANWYIGNQKNAVDSALLKVKPPRNLTRTPRSIRSMAQWKASEWRNWLLFYSLFVLDGVLPSVYFVHYMLLVQGISMLLSKSLSPHELDTAENYLNMFVREFEVLYGIELMTYNIHLLQHAASSVRDWGPLWGYSNFMFESNNGFLLDLFSGTQGVTVQICNTFTVFRSLPLLANRYINIANEHAHGFISKCLAKQRRGKKANVTGDVTLLGAAKHRKLTVFHKCLLEVIMTGVVPEYLHFYDRAIVNSELVHSESYGRSARRNNCCVELCDGLKGIVQSFVIVDSNCYVFFWPLRFSKYLFKTSRVKCMNTIMCTCDRTQLITRPANEIIGKLLFLAWKTTNQCYVCTFPNNWEVD